MSESKKYTFYHTNIKYKNKKMYITTSYFDGGIKSIYVAIDHKTKDSFCDTFFEYNEEGEHKDINQLAKQALKRTNLFTQDDEIEHYIEQIKPLMKLVDNGKYEKFTTIEPLNNH